MLAQGKFAHHIQRDAFANPEKAAQEHRHRDGAEYGDAVLIALRGIALAERFHQPRQPNGD